MSILQKLTEGIVNRDLAKEGAALQSKWERTGLLEGLTDDRERASMSRLLENQAKELLREVSTMAAGDVEGFAAVAFPIVRRVFGGLLANDLVSVQPMSLPSGLIFFLDFTYANARHGLETSGSSLYGGGVVGKGIQTGVTDITEEGGGFYNLAMAYSSPTGSIALGDNGTTNVISGPMADNTITDKDAAGVLGAIGATPVAVSALTEAQKKQIRYDADILGGNTSRKITACIVRLSTANMALIKESSQGHTEVQLSAMNLLDDDLTSLADATGDHTVVRRLTHFGMADASGNILDAANPEATLGDTTTQHITFYVLEGDTDGDMTADFAADVTITFPRFDNFEASTALGSVAGSGDWPLELAGNQATGDAGDGTAADVIPEIDIKVDSIAVTAVTKKLKAKWSPELGQDLNAYHNLDAEVELTSILSEQIALEIDREIVNDLIQGATAGTYYWSRSPGLFVNRATGAELGATAAAPDFTGTVSEWYETLIETINDVSAQIHRKTLRGGANFLVTSPEVANILEFTSGFRASVTADADRGTVGAVNVGSVSKKFDVYVDPYFPRNLVLVARKGGSFLESGYVYAPYVPLQVTPTIFGTEDFVPRKGVMTRYAKKMVRPDMYGLVVVRGLLGESGAS